MKIKFYQIDAFASEAFKGNPAAVCLLEETITPIQMQQIAMENNLSETAFLLKKADNQYDLKWFTPKVEIKLCGHATIASAFVLWQYNYVPKTEIIHFDTLSGELTANLDENGFIWLNFPAGHFANIETPEILQTEFGAENILHCVKTKENLLVELANEDLVRIYVPNPAAIQDYRLIITAKGNKEYDFVSRFFGLPVGVLEDPVTGSAHCDLAPYWSAKTEKTSFLAYQASTRGGELAIKLLNDRVLFSGKAVTTIDGYFYL